MDNYPISSAKYKLLAKLLLICFLVSLPLIAHSEGDKHPLGTLSPTIDSYYPNCRYGSIPQRNSVEKYDVASLNLGWYLTYPLLSSPRPNDILPVFFVRLRGRDCSSPGCPFPEYWDVATISPDLTDTGLGPMIDSNPGSIWIIGNEPDRVYYMDDVLPSQYAQAYHDAYTFIKARDPSAQVSIGGVVVPTPLRLQYLDMILDEYVTRYGRPMPVDIWNTHIHIVQEVRDSWGADIPAGIDQETGVLFTKFQHADVNTFKQLVIDFRSWMEERGQQDKPMIITELGILWPEWLTDEFGNPFDEPRVIDFMHQTMTWLDSYTDSALGYPADNHRLVQRWNWYSLDDDSTHPDGACRWNGWLFESAFPNERTVTGDGFADHTNQIPPTNDLLAYRFRTSPSTPPLVSPGETATVTLQIEISNGGNVPVDPPFIVEFHEQISDSLDLIATTTVTISVPGCGGLVTAEVEWPNISVGAHQILISIDPANAIPEINKTNNELVGTVLVATHRIYLPLISRQ